jgi:hypothetical protein
MQDGALRNSLGLLLIALCAIALSDCNPEGGRTYSAIKGDPQTRRHVLYDSSAVQAIASQALVAKQDYEFARQDRRPGTT